MLTGKIRYYNTNNTDLGREHYFRLAALPMKLTSSLCSCKRRIRQTVFTQASVQSVETKLTSTVLIRKQYLGCTMQSGSHLPCLESVEQRGHFLQEHNLRRHSSYTESYHHRVKLLAVVFLKLLNKNLFLLLGGEKRSKYKANGCV